VVGWLLVRDVDFTPVAHHSRKQVLQNSTVPFGPRMGALLSDFSEHGPKP
jgi:hypothetical protein